MYDLLWLIAKYAGYAYLLFYVTSIYYLAVMKLNDYKNTQEKRGLKVSTTIKFVAYPILIPGLIIDTVFNVVLGTIIFWEPPKEALFTARCDRWLSDSGWRGRRARWWCSEMLDPFDDGSHCRWKE